MFGPSLETALTQLAPFVMAGLDPAIHVFFAPKT
jgi:hypothetical protein